MGNEIINLRGLVFIFWLALGIYLGIAEYVGSKALENIKTNPGGENVEQSYDYDGLNFSDQQSLIDFYNEKNASKFFPWIFEVPMCLIPVLLAFAWGLVGGCGRLLKRIYDREEFSNLPLVTGPIFSALIGVLLFFISVTIPIVFSVGTTPGRSETIIMISFLGGLFSVQAHKWIENIAKFIFSKDSIKGNSK